MADSSRVALLVSHGSPEAESNKQFLRLRDALRERRPDLRVEAGFVEVAHPLFRDTLLDVLAEGATSVAVIPCMLFPGGNVGRDIPKEIKSAMEKRPQVKIQVSGTLSEQPSLVEILTEQIPAEAIKPGGTIVVLALAGGVATENRDAVQKLSGMIHLGSGMDTRFAFLDRGEPLLKDTLLELAKDKPESLIVLPAFLFSGIFMRSLKRTVEVFQAENEKPPVTMLEPFGLNSRMLTNLEAIANQLLGPVA